MCHFEGVVGLDLPNARSVQSNGKRPKMLEHTTLTLRIPIKTSLH